MLSTQSSVRQDNLGNGSDVQIKQDLARQHIGFANKFKLHKSTITSILLCGCKTLILLAASEKRIQAYEAESLEEPLRLSYFCS